LLNECSVPAYQIVGKNTQFSFVGKRRYLQYDEQLWLYYRVLGQSRDSQNKIYSFHAPEVSCIFKGKNHKKYELGNKSGFVITRNSVIILGAMAFEGNPYDGHTLEPQFDQLSDLMGRLTKVALVDTDVTKDARPYLK